MTSLILPSSIEASCPFIPLLKEAITYFNKQNYAVAENILMRNGLDTDEAERIYGRCFTTDSFLTKSAVQDMIVSDKYPVTKRAFFALFSACLVLNLDYDESIAQAAYKMVEEKAKNEWIELVNYVRERFGGQNILKKQIVLPEGCEHLQDSLEFFLVDDFDNCEQYAQEAQDDAGNLLTAACAVLKSPDDSSFTLFQNAAEQFPWPSLYEYVTFIYYQSSTISYQDEPAQPKPQEQVPFALPVKQQKEIKQHTHISVNFEVKLQKQYQEKYFDIYCSIKSAYDQLVREWNDPEKKREEMIEPRIPEGGQFTGLSSSDFYRFVQFAEENDVDFEVLWKLMVSALCAQQVGQPGALGVKGLDLKMQVAENKRSVFETKLMAHYLKRQNIQIQGEKVTNLEATEEMIQMIQKVRKFYDQIAALVHRPFDGMQFKSGGVDEYRRKMRALRENGLLDKKDQCEMGGKHIENGVKFCLACQEFEGMNDELFELCVHGDPFKEKKK